jgi:hypothetical protein
VFDDLVRQIEGADVVALETDIPPKVEEAKKTRTINPAEYRSLKTAFADRKKALAGNGATPSSPDAASDSAP